MIKMHILKDGENPVAVVLDYKEYMKLKAIAEDTMDYNSAIAIKRKTRKWVSHEDLKIESGLK